MPHIVLLGDSIFDNASYVAGGPDVVAHLKREMPEGWRATLSAIDGATTGSIPVQYGRIPRDATHLVLSIGGNDALMNVDILQRRASTVADALGHLADMRDRFENAYRGVVAQLLRNDLPLTVCTIYNGNFGDHVMQRLAPTALIMFNDAILRTAFELGLPAIELRIVCSEPEDYANPIEPSVQGGHKIAKAIIRAIEGQEGARGAPVFV
ncbi:SGNH/GDSL hydrolase family protein [Longimicrobium sp.]|jgi:hypothetical protein|uniref:SGNH/GDSL hydrolase family protein n=1 Tax=Longimicrobium sp. TaxID=2029185 RepID=UPI002ED82212